MIGGKRIPDVSGNAVTLQHPVRRRTIFIIIAFALMMMSIDATIVATALHALNEDLRAPINWTSWVITAYWLGYVVMLPVSGRLSERFGHRRVFLLSTAAFATASLACGLAGNIYTLVCFRALQSAGGAGLTPAATGIIVTHFGRSRDRVLGLFGAIFPVGAMIGPLFGGLFVTYASWRAVFFVNVPLGAIAALLGLWLIPPDRPADPSRRLDVTGMLQLGLAVVAGMLCASYLGDAGARLSSWRFLVPGALALGIGTRFFQHIHRVAEPFLEPRFIYARGFGATNLLNALYSGATAGAVTLVPLYATTQYGLNALDSGTLLIAEGIAAIVLSMIAAYALRWSGYRLPFYAGGLATVIGLLLLALAPRLGLTPYCWLALSTAFVGAGAGIMGPASRNACVQQVPQHASTLAALRATAQEFGVIVTLAVATAIMSRAPDMAAVVPAIYVALALLCTAAFPLIARVPEHRGPW